MTLTWVVLVVAVALDSIRTCDSSNVEGSRSRRGPGVRQRFKSGLPLNSARPLDPSQGRTRQQSNPRHRRLHSTDSITEERINEMTNIFKTNVEELRRHDQLDLIFVIDESDSVGLVNFLDEIKFVSRFVSGIEVDMNHTRVAVVTFADNVTSWTNQISMGEVHAHKCSLLGQDLPSITYEGGGTYTEGAMITAENILQNARGDSKKVIFLITDGKSNGGDPRPLATRLKRREVEIFTFGIKDGNRQELEEMASTNEHCLILNSFHEFEMVARRALHSDLESGNFIVEDDWHCNKFCTDTNCCHATADCRCGTTTGKYECVCRPGHYGPGLKHTVCQACPAGTYKPYAVPGDEKSCLPCPDERMTSPEAAISLDQCTCVEGFKKENDRCETLRCEGIFPPENGRFLACDGKYKSTCTAACNTGFDLRGTATIFCNKDEIWTALDGSERQPAFCQVRYCEALVTPAHGTMICSNDDNSYSTVCDFECEEGYNLYGSSSRKCDANRHWTGAETECREITCPVIPRPVHGVLSGECAREERGRYGEECSFSCPSDGFELLVPRTVTCSATGQWHPAIPNGLTKFCNDTAPPVISCPLDMTVPTLTRKAYADVSWEQPTATDNSETVILTPTWTFPVSLRIGEHVIPYAAKDGSGLVSHCQFTVTVEDREAPMIDHCRGPQPIVIERGETHADDVKWMIPRFSDNSGSLEITGNATFGTFPIGLTKVQYVATDGSGNSRSCMIDIFVQDKACRPMLRNPRGGHIDCRIMSDNTECELHCDTDWFGFAMVSYGNPLYICQQGINEWQPSPDNAKDCSRQKFSREILKDIQVAYDMASKTTCNDTNFIAGVRQAFIDLLSDKIPTLCINRVGGHLTCSLVDVSVKCVGIIVESDDYGPTSDYGDIYYYAGNYDDSVEDRRRRKRSADRRTEPRTDRRRRKRSAGRRTEPRHSKHKKLRRAKRQLSGSEAIPEYGDDYQDAHDGNYDGVLGDTEVSEYGEEVGDSVSPETLGNADTIGSPETDVNVNFDGSEQLPQEEITDLLNEAVPNVVPPEFLEQDEYGTTKERLEITVTIRGEVVMDGLTIEGDRRRHTNMVEFIRNLNIETLFSDPERILHATAVNGTDGDDLEYVKDTYAQSDELICPIGTVLRNRAFCVNCPVGTYYDVISANCKSCPIGYYQDHEARLSCQPCPIDTNTVEKHSRELSDCLSVCGPGFYSDTGVEMCNACPQGFFADYYGAIECAKCPGGNGTIGVAADSVEDCGELCEPGFVSSTGFAPCHPCPSGSKQDEPGKTFCYTLVDGQDTALERMEKLHYSECFAEPCKNNATCRGQGKTFLCKCQPGYTGDLCEIEIDECQPSPCAESATCVDLLNAFRCECAPGYTGTLCEDEIDECVSDPCQNGATCVDRLNAFSCDCAPGYEGFLCDVDTDDCVEHPCQNNGTCADEVAGFHCECAVGFEGLVCQTNTDDCEAGSCWNGATCIDGINEFRCECKPGFVGRFCRENINECASDPCVNGKCLDLVDSYKCLCPPTYLGEHCENVGDPYFDLYFGKPNTYHHVELDYALPNMTEVTVSFYLLSNHTETYGTPFSYATGDGTDADTLTLTDLSALTLYVNGDFVVSDSRRINDGRWYLVTVTWESEEGRWSIYLNGQLEDSGEGLATGQFIPGGGTLVIGQEQDTLGGGFSASQEFLGTISQFNIHNFAFSADQVLLLWRNCAGNVGNVRAWPEMGGGIIGEIEKVSTEFCRPCPVIESDEGTVVKIENDYTISVECNEGHEHSFITRKRQKVLPFRCGRSGTWRFKGKDVDASLLKCERVSCPDLEEIVLGSVTMNGSKYGDTATYSCNTGYQVVGRSARICEANKEWSHREPRCEDVDECQLNGACHDRANCTNSVGSYSCDCVYGWKGDGHTCQEINCGGAGSLKYGSISGNNFKLDGIVRYSCDYGYRLEGPAARTCLFNDSWSGEMPVCVKVECPEPEDVRHSSKHPEEATRSYKSEITYTCHPGYYLVGNATRECGPDSKWTGSLPSCERVSCGEPPIVANAINIQNEGIRYGAIVSYVCEQEYRLLGDPELRCNADRQWEAPSNKTPVCEHPTCNDPLSIINGRYGIRKVGEPTVTDAVYTYATEVEYVCNVGYNLVGKSILTCREREAWDASVPKCDIVSCGPPPVVENSQMEYNGERYGDLANYICLAGYLMEGEAALRCLASGKWTDEDQVNPSCNPRSCGAPQEVLHSRQTLSKAEDYVYKAAVRFECNLGYWPSGRNEIYCNTEGEWIPQQNFRCDIAVCPEPKQPLHGVFSRIQPPGGVQYEYNNTISYFCNDGFYSFSGPSLLSRCTETGQWSHLPLLCRPVECALPDPVENSTFVIQDGPYGAGAVFESTIVYTCDTGYVQLGGQMRRVCAEDRAWTGEAPSCTRVECGVQPTVQFSTSILSLLDPEADSDSLFYLDEVEYLCDVGFYLSGNGVVQCTADKTLTETPSCEPVSCGEPPVVAYSTMTQEHVYGENVFQSTTNYTCEQDFRMDGAPITTCGSNGHWDITNLAVCEPITCEEPDLVNNAIQFVSAREDDVAYPEIYKAGQYQPRSAAIIACDKGYEVVETVAKLLSVGAEIVSDEELARGITTKSIDKLPTAKQDRIRKILSKLLDEEPQLAALVTKTARKASVGTPKTLFIRQCAETVGWLKTVPKCTQMRCPLPYELENGHFVNVNDSEKQPIFETGVQYACNEGYKFADAESIDEIIVSQCVWNDTLWNVDLTEVPACMPLPCPEPPSISDGLPTRPEGEAFIYQDTVMYLCDEGYEMTSGSASLRCESSQTWSGDVPTCSRVKCPEPIAPENGRFKGRTFTYESAITFKCDKGYNLNGEANLTCQADRTWSAPYPRCDPVPCGSPPEVQNSNVLSTSEVYGGCAIYTCKHGFYLNGFAKIKCTADGTWETNLPLCNFMLCPKPPVTSHAIFVDSVLSELFAERDSNNYIYDDVVTYSCEEGYETDDLDDLSAICLTGENIPNIPTCDDNYYIEDIADGFWSRNPPVCTAKDCGPPPAAHENGIFIGMETTFNHSVHYRCKNGYFTNDENPSATCLSDAQWSRLDSPNCLPVSCGVPETPQNGYFNGTVFTFKETITYGCDEGHDLIGQQTITCQATGIWSDSKPVCEPKDCGRLPLVENGELAFEDTIFGEEAMYSCNSGYYMRGRSLFECTALGRWSHPKPPLCLPVDCGVLLKPKNGLVNATGHVFMNRAVYSCLSGYNLIGKHETECLANASWSSKPPTCEPVDCEQPEPLENAQMAINGSTTFQSSQRYFCNSGYEMATSGIVTCMADGTWSARPTCSRVKCPAPGRPQFGVISVGAKTEYVYEDVVKYTCNQGYFAVGETVTACTAARTWSNPLPRCQPVDCGLLPHVVHGTKSGSQTTFMTVINFSCWPGFYVAGNSSTECLHTAKWSSEPPTCERVSCGRPPHLKHGSISGASGPSEWVYENHVLFSCDAGYHLSGGSGAECAEDGEWILDYNYYDEDAETEEDRLGLPICEIIRCEGPPIVDHGSFIDKNYTFGVSVTYTCDEGYEKEQSGDITCTGNTTSARGFYMGEPPVCDPVSCGPPREIENGQVTSDEIVYQGLAVYSCNQGYNLIGDPVAECLYNKRWSTYPRCDPKNCGLPELPEHSNMTVESTLYPATVAVECEKGYNLKGADSMDCTTEGVWSNQGASECTPVVCGNPQSVENGIFSFNGIVFKNQASYHCQSGYNLIPQGVAPIGGTVTIKCQADGSWQDGRPRCEPVECGIPPVTENGHSDITTAVVYPQSVDYACNYGYSFIWLATTTLQCTESGQFSSPAPRCYAVSCGAPPSRKNALVETEAYTYGNVATYTCKYGYTMETEKSMSETLASECTGEALWEPLPPAEGCVPYDCGPPLILLNAEVPSFTTNTTFGSLHTYECIEGHEASPETLTINCQRYGEWSAGPSCEPVDCGAKQCPPYAKCESTGTIYESAFTANCIEGYEFKPNVASYTVKCTADAAWNDPEEIENPEECVRLSCGHAPVVLNARSVSEAPVGESELFGSRIRYSCNAGYDQVGANVMECLSNGSWGPNPPPSCVPKDCGDPPSCIEEANCTFETTTFLSRFTVVCNEGYELERDISTGNLRCTESGEWEQPDPETFKCQAMECVTLPTIKHGRPQHEGQGKNPTYQDKIGYECDTGYYVEGIREVKCQSDRTYTEVPECLPVSCGEPFELENGDVESTGNTFQHRTNYQCHPGYYMEGRRSWICDAAGEWIAENEINARGIVVAKSAALSGYTTHELQEKLSEASGHDAASGDSESASPISMMDMAVSGRSLLLPSPNVPPKCRPVPCGAPPTVSNTEEVFTAPLVFEEFITYRCKPGFEMVGEPVLRCQSNGGFGPNLPPTCVRVRCPMPEPTEHCEVIGSAPFRFEDTVIYRPVKGFEFLGNSLSTSVTITCMENAESDIIELPPCVPVTCGTPVTPLNGRFAADAFTYRQNATYSCDLGYDLVGPSTITCLSTREWSADAPGCRPVSCGTPPFLSLGSMTLTAGEADPFTYRKTVEYQCDLGHKFDSDQVGEVVSIQCEYNRRWDSSPPECIPVPCPELQNVDRGNFTLSGAAVFRARASYQCASGYEMQGEPLLICQADGTWTSDPPVCQPVSCDFPPRVAYAKQRSLSALAYGERITYECIPGYELFGSMTLTCSEDRTFDNEAPVCLPIECGHPPKLEFGHFLKNAGGYLFQSTITYRCSAGYRMISEADDLQQKSVSCLANREWSDGPPKCEIISCQEPAGLENGHADFGTTTYRSMVDYSCKPGYEISKNSSHFEHCRETSVCMICQANGIWGFGNSESPPIQPVCRPVSCGEPPALEHGSFESESLVFEGSATYTCDKGYEFPEDKNFALKCGSSAHWEPQTAPSCRRVKCRSPIQIDHGLLHLVEKFSPDSNDFVYGDIITYTCDRGHVLSAVENLTCESEAIWDSEPPVCYPVNCGPPPSRRHGHLIGVDDVKTTFQSLVRYGCDEGYEDTEGKNITELTCTADGVWSAAEPTPCKAVDCGSPSDVAHGTYVLENDETTFRSEVEYVCDIGHELVGDGLLSCHSDKLWKPSTPTCSPVSCSVPPKIHHGIPEFELERAPEGVGHSDPGRPDKRDAVSKSGFVYQDTVEYSCDMGYTIEDGPRFARCNENGSWVDLPICTIVTCDPLPAGDNSSRIEEDTIYLSVVEYTCDEGFILEDNTTSINCVCGGDGFFAPSSEIHGDGVCRDSLPACGRVSCGSPPIVSNSFLKPGAEEFFFQDEVVYACLEGYEMKGESTLRCNANGRYNHPPPQCVRVSCGLPEPVDNAATLVLEGIRFGDEVTYECHPGYRIVSDSNHRVCQADAQWSDDCVKCDPINCTKVDAPIFGNILVLRGVTFGSSVVFECQEGYELVGNRVITCDATGNWSSSVPECIPILCDPIPIVENGIPTSDVVRPRFGNVVGFFCLEGYEIHGQPQIDCLSNGTWTTPPSCPPVKCLHIPEFPNSVVTNARVDPVTFGQTVQYACNSGYRLESVKDTLTCEFDGTFSDRNIVCERIPCPPTPLIEYGSPSNVEGRYGDWVTYSCDSGYKIIGSDSVRCGILGSWVGPVPTCYPILCGAVPFIEHAIQPNETEEYSYQDVAVYECEEGYELINGNSAVCQADGSFLVDGIGCSRVSCDLAAITQGMESTAGSGDDFEALPLPHILWTYSEGEEKSLRGSMTYLSEAVLTCESGFVLESGKDEEKFVCQADKTWSNDLSLVNCIPIECPELPLLANGIMDVTRSPERTRSHIVDDLVNGTLNFVFGARVSFSCQDGYELEGALAVTCDEEGRWSSLPPTCNPVPCGVPPYVENAVRLEYSFTYGMLAEYECLDGYYFDSEAKSRSCRADGTFSDEEVVCTPVLCPEIPTTNHGKPKNNVSRSWDENSYVCEPGYESYSVVRCLPTGEWSGALEECSPVDCELAPLVKNAEIFEGRDSNFVFGDSAFYTCNEGHLLPDGSNSLVISCETDGSFPEPEYGCEPVECDLEHPFANGRLIAEKRKAVFNDTAQLVCSEGYESTGSQRAVCTATGEWDANDAGCQIVQCGFAPKINNASPVLDQGHVYSFAESARYSCEEGYELSDPEAALLCQSNGSFADPGLEFCIPVTCLVPGEMAHGSVSTEVAYYGEKLIVTCDVGYEVQGFGQEEITLKCQGDGEWSENISSITCAPIVCDSPQLLENGMWKPDLPELSSYHFDSTILYHCNTGYTLRGVSKQNCLPDGSWSGTVPECVPVKCGLPPFILHGRHLGGEEYSYGNEISYECDEGYRLDPRESLTRTCNENGLWTGSHPICRLINCGAPPPVENGETDSFAFTYQSEIEITCNEGYSMLGSSKRVCRADGSWSGVDAVCQRISCGRHPVVRDGVVTPANASYAGQEVEITCKGGFELFGDSVRVCEIVGEWGGVAPRCVRYRTISTKIGLDIPAAMMLRTCPPPVINGTKIKLVDGAKEQPVYFEGDKLEYCCSPGYIPTSDMTIQCVDGSWKGKPKCIPQCRHKCLNRGRCSRKNRCTCAHGWEGSRCHKPVCTLPCLNGGFCSGPFLCSCKRGWTGTRCQTPVCTKPCQNGGKCESPDFCYCPYGYGGEDCSEAPLFSLW